MKCFTHGARTWETKGRGSGRAGERGPWLREAAGGTWASQQTQTLERACGAPPSAQALCTARRWLPCAAAMGRQGDRRVGRQAEELPTWCESVFPQIIILFSQGFYVFLILALCLWPPPTFTQPRNGLETRGILTAGPGTGSRFFCSGPHTHEDFTWPSFPGNQDLSPVWVQPTSPRFVLQGISPHKVANEWLLRKKERGHKPCTHLTFMTCPRPGCSSGSGCSSPARTPVQFITTSMPWANI